MLHVQCQFWFPITEKIYKNNICVWHIILYWIYCLFVAIVCYRKRYEIEKKKKTGWRVKSVFLNCELFGVSCWMYFFFQKFLRNYYEKFFFLFLQFFFLNWDFFISQKFRTTQNHVLYHCQWEWKLCNCLSFWHVFIFYNINISLHMIKFINKFT